MGDLRDDVLGFLTLLSWAWSQGRGPGPVDGLATQCSLQFSPHSLRETLRFRDVEVLDATELSVMPGVLPVEWARWWYFYSYQYHFLISLPNAHNR